MQLEFLCICHKMNSMTCLMLDILTIEKYIINLINQLCNREAIMSPYFCF
nr:MAG TPA: hypothetical protein [Crassvirales sp.]